MVDYIKCELIGGGSSRHLNTFSNLLIVSVRTLAIVDCTHVHHVVHYKIIRTYQSCCIVDYSHAAGPL